jgi:glycosyltransferase involved in cell wall biosynthesis
MSRPAAPRRILVSLGKSAPGDGGIFEFSSQLARRIVLAAPAWRERWNVEFTLHLRPQLLGHFGPGVAYLPLVRLQRLVHLQPLPYALWHSLNQLNRFRPPRGCGRRLVTVHDLNYLYDRRSGSTWIEHRRTRNLLARADHVVAISQHTADDITRHLGWEGPLDVIYNGATNLSGHAQTPLPGVDVSRPFLLHLSRMSPSKNPQAILNLARIWPEMQFLMCGASSADADALARANTLANVQFHLYISDEQKAWAYAHCAGFIFPSLAEGFGLPPVEAMHFGKPVFLARRTCLPEIGGSAADYFDDFDPMSMKAVVELGLRRQCEPGRMQVIREHAARFDWDRTAQAYLSLYARQLGLVA